MRLKSRRLYIVLVLSFCVSFALAWALGAAGAHAAPAAALTYPGPGACAATLQSCINSANDGDSITIAAGTYVTSVTVGKAVSLTGATPTTTLSALAGQRVLSVTAAASNALTLSQLTITGGAVNGDGGGLLVARSAPVHVFNMTFVSNAATGSGGGIDIAPGSGAVSLQTVLFNSNSASQGGALHIASGVPVSLLESSFISNTATSGSGGAILNEGVLTLERSPAILFSVGFLLNHAQTAGGAIDNRPGAAFGTGTLPGQNAVKFDRNFAIGGSGGAVSSAGLMKLSSAVFISNSARTVGGGLSSAGTFTLSNTQFISNSAAAGGGVYAAQDAAVSNSLFQGNVVSMTASGLGGGMAVSGTLALTGTQFLSNTAGTGSGVYVTGSVSVSNSQFVNNQGNQTGCTCGGALMGVASVLVISSTFERNSGNQTSGLLAGGSLTLTDSVFAGNTSIDGAASMYFGVAHINGGRFENNNSWLGGGLYLSNGSATLSGTQFISNAATVADGGGLFSYVPLTVTNGLFMSNTAAPGRGGGLYAAAGLIVDTSRFISNTAQGGGGLLQDSLFNGNGRIVNSLFTLNRATIAGAGADLDLRSGGRVAVLHDTIAGYALNPQPGITVMSGTVGITDTIVTSHSIGISHTAGSLRVAYDVLYANTLPTYSGGGSLLIFSTSLLNPLFIAPATGDFHIGPGSGALDTGINAGVNLDFDGDARPIGPGFDIGFDERRVYLYLPAVMR